MEKSRDVEDYWRQKEEALQEPVLFRSIAQWTRGGRGIADVFGLLYMTATRLIFEYSDRPRKSILDSLLRGKDGDRLDESLTIPLEDIRWVGRIASNRVRRWMRQGKDTPQILREAEGRPSAELVRFFLGAHLCVSIAAEFYAFLTPSDREWEMKLKAMS